MLNSIFYFWQSMHKMLLLIYFLLSWGVQSQAQKYALILSEAAGHHEVLNQLTQPTDDRFYQHDVQVWLKESDQEEIEKGYLAPTLYTDSIEKNVMFANYFLGRQYQWAQLHMNKWPDASRQLARV